MDVNNEIKGEFLHDAILGTSLESQSLAHLHTGTNLITCNLRQAGTIEKLCRAGEEVCVCV